MGKLDPTDFSFCTSFSASAHKFSGPKGVGWLACKRPFSLQLGGGQENGLRGGTENYPAIISMLTAFQQSQENLSTFSNRANWRDQFEFDLEKCLPQTQFLGRNNPRLWNTSMFVLPKFENLSWIGKLDKIGFSVSTGSACSTGNMSNSLLTSSMGLSTSQVRRLVRVSSYSEQTQKDWQDLALAFKKVYDELEMEASCSSVISL